MQLGVNQENIVVCLHAMGKIDEENSTCSALVSCSLPYHLLPKMIEPLLSAGICFFSQVKLNQTQPNSELNSKIV